MQRPHRPLRMGSAGRAAPLRADDWVHRRRAAGEVMSHPPGVIPAGPCVPTVVIRYRAIRHQTVGGVGGARWTGTCQASGERQPGAGRPA
jgi:hypothetical protein